jgi:Uma2 family endonuclease
LAVLNDSYKIQVTSLWGKNPMTAITVNFKSIIDISDEQFYQLCMQNPDTKFERNVDGEIIIMPPTGGETGKRNAKLITRFTIWNEQTGLGEVFDSSTGYTLPSKANRSPDVSWIKQERWNSLTLEQRQKFIPLAPDFVLELMSPSDYLVDVQGKMQEYLDNGVQLGWLINPEVKQVEIYRLGQDVELLNSPASLSGEDILPGFVLDLTNI